MIRPAASHDFAFVYGLYMHPDVNPYLLYEPMSETDFKTVFDELLVQGTVYVFSDATTDAGMFKFIPLQHRCSHVHYLGGVAIHPDYAGRGLGSRMVAEILELGRQRSLKRIELSTATTNHRAIRLYQRHGFVLEGTLRQYAYLAAENRWLDEHYMAYLYP